MTETHVRKLAAAVFLLVSACSGTPDPRTVEGALGYAARAIDLGDAKMLYRVVDARSRHAMISIVSDRQSVGGAHSSLVPGIGEGERAREPRGCRGSHGRRRPLRATLRRPVPLRHQRTPRGSRTYRDARGRRRSAHVKGTTLSLHRAHEGDWYGLVWKTDELVRERDRANRDRHAIAENAAIYDRRRALEGSTPTP